MSERYSVLRPLNEEEMHFFACQIFNFFNPLHNRTIRKEISWQNDTGAVRPFSLWDFLEYLSKTGKCPDPHKYMAHIQQICNKMTEYGVLTLAGYSQGAPGLNRCYYAMKELTDLEAENTFWLGVVLGENYLRKKLEAYIVRIEGESSKGIGTGSGILISENCILTCRHNIVDMNITSCWIGERRLEIISAATHDKYDIGIIKIAELMDYNSFPYLGSPYILDKTLTLGYPPISGMREPLLFAQRGEINAIGKETFSGCECVAISSITHPGNSGGPVFSLYGYIVGIVTESTMFVDSFDSKGSEKSNTGENTTKEDCLDNNKNSPFYLAISSNTIRNAVSEIGEGVEIRFEDYQ